MAPSYCLTEECYPRDVVVLFGNLILVWEAVGMWAKGAAKHAFPLAGDSRWPLLSHSLLQLVELALICREAALQERSSTFGKSSAPNSPEGHWSTWGALTSMESRECTLVLMNRSGDFPSTRPVSTNPIRFPLSARHVAIEYSDTA